MSPRAAWRLESIGFPRVYDFAAGKADWGSFGLPLDGDADASSRVSSLVTTEVPTCRLDERVDEVAARLPESWDVSVVTNDANVVLGLLGRNALRTKQEASVEETMSAGPRTIRPSARLDAIRTRMRKQNLTRIIVSRSDGTLVGILRAEDMPT